MAHLKQIAISTSLRSAETCLYGLTRVEEWFHWMRVNTLCSLPIQMPPELLSEPKSGLHFGMPQPP